MRRESIAAQAERHRKRRLAAIKRRAARLTTKKLEDLVASVPGATHVVAGPRTLAKFKAAQLKSAKLVNVKTAATLDEALATPPLTLYALDDALGAIPQAIRHADAARGALVDMLDLATLATSQEAGDVGSRARGGFTVRKPDTVESLAQRARELASALRAVQATIEHLQDAAKEIARGPFKKEKPDASA